MRLVLFVALTAMGALAIAAGADGGAPVAGTPGPPAAATQPAGAPQAPSNTVKIVFTTYPMKKAFVYWGKRRLGMIAPHAPLVVERPRDSGPLDVVVKADGFINVQTRAYTFADSKVGVRLTPPDQKKTLLGYREEVPPPDGGVSLPSASLSPDGGAAR
jgi:hypothetical protein